MTKFRKKPVVIDAMLLTEKTIRDVYSFIFNEPDLSSIQASDQWEEYERIVLRNGLKIKTLEGEMTASMGDYVIKGVNGEFYPCKPDIFEKTYEKVEENQ